MQPNNSTRIALVEDSPVNRTTFRQHVQLHPDWQLVFIASDGQDCLVKLKNLEDRQLPQVVFMDIEMPRLNGIHTIAIALSMYPQIHFIVLTVFDDDEKIFEAIRAGASGYLLKHEPHTVLEEAIHNVLHLGGAPMSPGIARKTLQLLSAPGRQADQKQSPLPQILTEREKEILQYTVSGQDAKRIAVLLDISVMTVRKHIANLYEKLQVQSKAQIIHMAHKNNWYKG